MAPRTEQQFEEIRDSRKKEIMDAALQLFATDGFYVTSISKIAEKAGISKGLLYNYFTGKDDLIKNIIFNGIDNITRFVDPNRDGFLTKEEMKFFLDEMFQALQNEPLYWRLYFNLFFQPHVMKLVEKRLTVLINKYIKMLAQYFKSAGAEDPEAEALFFSALLDGIGFQFMISPEHFPLDKMKVILLKLYC